MKKLYVVMLLIVGITLASCSRQTTPTISRTEAINLMNEGKVTEIGVTHTGWTILTLEDGTFVQNSADVIGFPGDLLSNCLNCENTSRWIE